MPERNGQNAKRGVALIDVDRTLGPAVTLNFMEHQVDNNLIEITEDLKRAIEQMYLGISNGNYINPLNHLLRLHVAAQANLPEKEVEAQADEFCKNYEHWFAYVRPLFKAFAKHEYADHLISAGPHVLVNAIARLFGATGTFSTVYDVIEKNGDRVFSGKIFLDLASPGRRAKAAITAVGMYAYKGSMMFADSIADAAAMGEVEFPFCINPSPGLEAIARQQDPEWPIVSLIELSKKRVPDEIMKALGNQALFQATTPQK